MKTQGVVKSSHLSKVTKQVAGLAFQPTWVGSKAHILKEYSVREKAVVLGALSTALVDSEAPGNEAVLTFCGGDRFGRT